MNRKENDDGESNEKTSDQRGKFNSIVSLPFLRKEREVATITGQSRNLGDLARMSHPNWIWWRKQTVRCASMEQKGKLTIIERTDGS